MLFFQARFRFSSCGVLLGEVMVAFTEHPVVDVVLVVEDTALGSTNIQVNNHAAQNPEGYPEYPRLLLTPVACCNCAILSSRRSNPII